MLLEHPYSPYHPTAQTDQPTPSDNAHTHRDSARPITLSGLEKDTALFPYHIIAKAIIIQATFFIFILPRKAKMTFGVIRVILRLALAVTPKLHLAPRIQPSCPTGLPAFTEYLSRGSLVIGDHIVQFSLLIARGRRYLSGLIEPLNLLRISKSTIGIYRRLFYQLVPRP